MKISIFLYKFLIISGILFVSIQCYSQDEIEFDFHSKTFTNAQSLDNIKDGEYYKLKIININTNLYKISLFASDTVRENKIEFPTFGNFSLDNITKILTALGQTSVTVTPLILGLDGGSSAEEYELTYRIVSIEIPKVKMLTDSLIAIKERLNTLIFDFKNEILKTKFEFKENHDFDDLTDSLTINECVKRINEIRASLLNLSAEASQEEESYLTFLLQEKFKPYLDEKTGDKKLIAAGNGIKAGYIAIKTAISAALDTVSATKSADLIASLITVSNNKSYKYISLPFRLMGDNASLEIKIEPRDQSSLLQSYYTRIKFPNKRVNQITVGTAFYFSNLYNESFAVNQMDSIFVDKSGIPVDTTTLYSVVEGDINQKPFFRVNEIGMQLNVNFFFNSAKYYFTFGPAISFTDKVRPRLFLGFGYGFGKRNLLTLSLGAMGGLCDRKSNAVNLNTFYTNQPQQLTTTKLEVGYYVSLGYMFSL